MCGMRFLQKKLTKIGQIWQWKLLKENTAAYTYLIFVIFFTQAKFWENKIYTEKRSKSPIFCSKLLIFLQYIANFLQWIANFSS